MVAEAGKKEGGGYKLGTVPAAKMVPRHLYLWVLFIFLVSSTRVIRYLAIVADR